MTKLNDLAIKFAKIIKSASSYHFAPKKELSQDQIKALDYYKSSLADFTINELRQVRKKIQDQIDESLFEQERTAEFEGNNDFQPEVPKFLMAKLNLIDKAIQNIK